MTDVIERIVFWCKCSDDKHHLFISRFTAKEYDDPDIYISAGLIDDLPFFKRLWVAILYLFKIRSNPYYFEIILSPEDAQKAANILLQEVQ